MEIAEVCQSLNEGDGHKEEDGDEEESHRAHSVARTQLHVGDGKVAPLLMREERGGRSEGEGMILFMKVF